jgi:hypothetical protein
MTDDELKAIEERVKDNYGTSAIFITAADVLKLVARVKELEGHIKLADAVADCDLETNKRNLRRINRMNFSRKSERCRAEKAESALKVATEALSLICETYAHMVSYAPLWLSQARAALAKIKEKP